MSELGKLPNGLVKAIGSDLFWGMVRSELRLNPSTGELIIAMPLANGLMILELGTVPGDLLSGS